ncbi:MAG: hypothetical protein NTZ26_07385 [Candidatus Aminicenantes bacterium]|nr:hypothetical protein [Candidatus Aminicenantes bacterium]
MDKRERAFELDLPTVVRGRDARAEDFVEPARLASVSAEEARLWLKSAVEPGAKLLFSMAVPRTTFLGSSFRLSLSGTVLDIHPCPSAGRPERLVSLRLNPGFRVTPNTA